MARDYKRAAKQPASERAPGSWLSFLTGLGIGLVGAVLVYWWMQTPGNRLPPAATEAASTPATVPEDPPATPPVEAEQLALPKFDFYKILPEIEVKVPESELAEPQATEGAADKTPESTEAGGTFILQVASFQDFNDADQAKAQLALQGVQATIQRVVINGQDVWHRVHVGPFSNLNDAQRTRTRLSQLGVNAIVLRLGGGED
jgi:cell division protein FtsN